ncbi:addiction module protein [Variovorax sp. JS1663]|uniref:addiction module protein n=1 Tax=Variovorax sp. JS1663 TaxID=1851577 RepID=UPI00192CE908|nr:addiction module protein [Variovorax sp. JS1663]
MSTSRAKAKLFPFDAARYLTDNKAMAEYMTAVLESEDTDLLLLALSDMARAKGLQHSIERPRPGTPGLGIAESHAAPDSTGVVASYRPQPQENAMSVPVEVLAQQVLQLPASDRARLLDQVISSLDADRERDARWNELAARRDAEADTDPSVLVSGPDAVARIRASLE